MLFAGAKLSGFVGLQFSLSYLSSKISFAKKKAALDRSDLTDRMRRSAAPSQLQGNAAKRPRFVPPGPSQTGMLGNGLSKHHQSGRAEEHLPSSEIQKCESTVEAPAVPKVSGVCKALARVLSAVPQGESKENALEPSSVPVDSEPTPNRPDQFKTQTTTTPVGLSKQIRVRLLLTGLVAVPSP
ncbi:hypothetical protein SRHO_G00280390 [Serrasalmus rhombeus]